MMTKWALTKAGDITAKPEGKTARRHNIGHKHHKEAKYKIHITKPSMTDFID
jgi:hypothetical protein